MSAFLVHRCPCNLCMACKSHTTIVLLQGAGKAPIAPASSASHTVHGFTVAWCSAHIGASEASGHSVCDFHHTAVHILSWLLLNLFRRSRQLHLSFCLLD